MTSLSDDRAQQNLEPWYLGSHILTLPFPISLGQRHSHRQMLSCCLPMSQGYGLKVCSLQLPLGLDSAQMPVALFTRNPEVTRGRPRVVLFGPGHRSHSTRATLYHLLVCVCVFVCVCVRGFMRRGPSLSRNRLRRVRSLVVLSCSHPR